MIFDYQNEYDFKFAGINVSLDKIQMGHRTAAGWVVDVQSNVQVKPGIDYNLLVAVNGTNVTLLVNNQTYFSYTFAPRWMKAGMYMPSTRGWSALVRTTPGAPSTTWR